MIEQDQTYEIGDNYTYECEKYFMYTEDRVSTCLSNLTWSLSPPVCVGKVNVIEKCMELIITCLFKII